MCRRIQKSSPDDVSMIDKDNGTGQKMDGSDLKAKLIDVFHLVPQ